MCVPVDCFVVISYDIIRCEKREIQVFVALYAKAIFIIHINLIVTVENVLIP